MFRLPNLLLEMNLIIPHLAVLPIRPDVRRNTLERRKLKRHLQAIVLLGIFLQRRRNLRVRLDLFLRQRVDSFRRTFGR
ncbi:hypothetical protein EYC84_001293 [Monilinia fructicola]|uniref:Uncharacterized protein n=1 Tax=Monilinia fructicola TaxID=38448 RepID=A0A5M9JPJ0_MONFR|nr:hypothetical protein EYC84_001293 [Monilinia fructicola]